MRIKIIFYYLLEFILSIMVLLLLCILSLKFTLLNPNYVIKELKKNNYYNELCKTIKHEMSNYIIQSGLDEIVLENIYTKEMVTEEVNSIINSFYKNKKIKVNTTEVKDKLETNIITYLEKNNIKITDQDSLDRFVNQILEVYKEKLLLNDAITMIQPKLVKVNSVLTLLSILLTIASIITALIIFLVLKKEALAIPLFMSSITIMLINYLLFATIDVKHILFWNDSISKIIKSIVYNLSSIIMVSSIVLILLGVILSFVSICYSKRVTGSDHVLSVRKKDIM